jgi:hypothetical protein
MLLVRPLFHPLTAAVAGVCVCAHETRHFCENRSRGCDMEVKAWWLALYQGMD